MNNTITKEQHLINLGNALQTDYRKLLVMINKVTNNYTDNKEILHQVYLKCYNTIEKNGFEGDNYSAYLFSSCRNFIYQETKQKKSKTDRETELINSDIYYNSTLLDPEKLVREVLIDSLFKDVMEYVEANYNPIDAGLFKYRFLTSHSLAEISQLTGFNISQIFYRTNKITLDLREKYKDFFDV